MMVSFIVNYVELLKANIIFQAGGVGDVLEFIRMKSIAQPCLTSISIDVHFIQFNLFRRIRYTVGPATLKYMIV